MMNPKTKKRLTLAAMIVCPLLISFLAIGCVSIDTALMSGALALGMAMAIKDADLEVSIALPNGAATVNTAGIDLGHTANGDFTAPCELEIEAPALTTAALPDTQTMTYEVWHDTDSAFGTEAKIIGEALVQTGAGGAGDAAATVQVRLPVDVNQHIRVKAINSGVGDASGVSVTARLVF